MKQKKNTKIVAIFIGIVCILLIAVGIAFLFLATDLFKSNQELFFKYAGQLFEKENGFIEQDVINYLEKMKETPFQNEGNLSFEATFDGQSEEHINQLTIDLSGIIDEKNQALEENISINYSPEITFPITIKKSNGELGYQTQYVGSKYVVDTQTNEQENRFSIPFTQEELKSLFQTYGERLSNQCNEEQFSKVENGDLTGYKITLTEDELKAVEKTILETLKEDQTTKEKLNIVNTDIDDIIKQLEEEKQSDVQTELTVYQEKGRLVKVELKSQKINATLEKTENQDQLQYQLFIEQNELDNHIGLTLSYRGLSTLQEIEENHVLEIGVVEEETSQEETQTEDLTNLTSTQQQEVTYQLTNKITFIENSNIEDFNDDNALILSNYDEAQVEELRNSIEERLNQVNQSQMEELGVETSENPLLKAIGPMQTFFEQSLGVNSTNEVDVNTFNQKFELYQSTNLQGTTVRGLLTTIATNNGINEEDETVGTSEKIQNTSRNYKIKEIHFNGEEYEVNQQNIAAIKQEVVPENYYRVEFEKDSNTGVIYRAVINPK